MRSLDFSSWQTVLSTIVGIAVITLIGVGIRLLVMQRVQQRRERENRQINERLRTLIAAYRTLGGSFTGDLAVDPTHLRDLKQRAARQAPASGSDDTIDESTPGTSSDRSRRMRDAVEAALSDILLLGTEEQVRLAASAANDLVAGRPIHTDGLVASLRDFIRRVLDLEPVPAGLDIPRQGPTRPQSSGGRGKGGDGGREGGGGGRGGGMGMGVGLGLGGGLAADESSQPRG
jgi:type II secretory pathway pseudopilin PulG